TLTPSFSPNFQLAENAAHLQGDVQVFHNSERLTTPSEAFSLEERGRIASQLGTISPHKRAKNMPLQETGFCPNCEALD
ncbi:hypothetical protein WAJ74_21250, partial [Acinetobacter baumannii]